MAELPVDTCKSRCREVERSRGPYYGFSKDNCPLLSERFNSLPWQFHLPIRKISLQPSIRQLGYFYALDPSLPILLHALFHKTPKKDYQKYILSRFTYNVS